MCFRMVRLLTREALSFQVHPFAAEQKTANIVSPGVLNRKLARLDHQIERIGAGLKGQPYHLVAAGGFVDPHHYVHRPQAVFGVVAVDTTLLNPVNQFLCLCGCGR